MSLRLSQPKFQRGFQQLISTIDYNEQLRLMQEQYPASYSSDIEKIKRHINFYTALVQYSICSSCKFRIFSIMNPKIYNDHDTIRNLSGDQPSNESLCWLCSGILQAKFIEALGSDIIKKIKENHYGHKKTFKLNVRVDNMLTIKFQIFCNLLMQEFAQQSECEVKSIQQQIIVPLFQKNCLEIKTVFKWILSNALNQLPHEVFGMKSTINEDENSVVVTIGIQDTCEELQNFAGKVLGRTLHLNVVKSKQNRNKKLKIDIEDEQYQVKWTNGMITRINQISIDSWKQIASKYTTEALISLEKQRKQSLSSTIELSSENVFLCGRYVKFSRYLSQTPWIVSNKKMTETSLQESMQKRLIQFFYPQKIPQNQIQIKFHAGGRQDVDVRMLKGGRPFVLEFVSPRFHLKDIPISKILDIIKKDHPQSFNKLPAIEGLTEPEEEQIKIQLLELLINANTDSCKALNLQKTTVKYISNELKQAEGEKIKHYVCYIQSEQPFIEGDKQQLQKYENLPILQKTPIRVLHRRTLMYRNKMVHKMIFHQVTKYSAVLQIWASAGTYIKEFVHGDMNRTLPNIGSLLKKQVDILQLDVGSLKEGEWLEGAHEDMKLGKLAWE